MTVDFNRDKSADTGGFEIVQEISLRERGKRTFWKKVKDDVPVQVVDEELLENKENMGNVLNVNQNQVKKTKAKATVEKKK